MFLNSKTVLGIEKLFTDSENVQAIDEIILGLKKYLGHSKIVHSRWKIFLDSKKLRHSKNYSLIREMFKALKNVLGFKNVQGIQNVIH